MGAEHDVRLGHPACKFHVVVKFFVRVYNVELRHITPMNIVEAGIVGNFFQGRSQGKRISTEFGATRVGHVLALAGNGESGHEAEKVPDGTPDKQSKQENEKGRKSTAVLFSAGTATGRTQHSLDQPYGHRLYGRKDSYKYDAHHHKAGIAVLDVGQFVSNDRRQFRIIKLVYKASGQRNGERRNIYAAGEGVQLTVIDNVDLRHLDTARNAEIFDHVVDTQVLLALQRFRVSDMPNNRRIGTVGNDKPKARHRKGEGHGILEVVPDDIPMEGSRLRPRRAGPIPAEPAEKIQSHDSQKHHPEKNHGKHTKEDNRIAVIPPNLGLDTDVFH